MNNERTPDLLPIGIVAKSYGVSENCIRRMESAGLLEPAYISEKSGYRYYDSANISRIGTVLSLRSFGFVNKDIKEHFTHAGDYSALYHGLIEKQRALNYLVEKMSRKLKNFHMYQCEVIEYEETYCCIKKEHIRPSLEAISEISRRMLYETVRSDLPVDYSRAILIKTDCMDYKKFRREQEQDLTFCLPLRKKAEGPYIDRIPAGKVVSFAWSFSDLDYPDIIPLIDELMNSKDLAQVDTLRAAYDIGGYTGDEITAEDTVMHILIPIEQILQE